MADLGEGPVPPSLPSPLILGKKKKKSQKEEKTVGQAKHPLPHPLAQGLDPPPHKVTLEWLISLKSLSPSLEMVRTTNLYLILLSRDYVVP